MQGTDPEEGVFPDMPDDLVQLRRLRRQRRRRQFSLIGLFGLTYVVAVLGAYWRVLGPEGSLGVVTYMFAVAYVFAPLLGLLILHIMTAMSEGRTALGIFAICGAMLLGGRVICSLHKRPEMFYDVAGVACCAWSVQGVLVALVLAMPGPWRTRQTGKPRGLAARKIARSAGADSPDPPDTDIPSGA